MLNGERTKRPDSTRYQTSYRGHHPDKALEVAHIFWGKRFGGGYWILDREVGSTGAKYSGLVNRVDTSNPDRPEHQPDKIVLLISNQWHINCTSSDYN